jgi:DNA-binding transcriptional ArsR family regulator
VTELDPVIQAPARLRIMAALAALADGDSLSFSRLQQLLDLTAGNLITHLRRLLEPIRTSPGTVPDSGVAGR